MSNHQVTQSKGVWYYAPYLIGDLILLITAWLIYVQAERPMVLYEAVTCASCVALGAWLSILPFRWRQEAELRSLEVKELKEGLSRLEHAELAAERIAQATGHWQTVQDLSAKAVASAKEITERMHAEAREFQIFMEKTADAERDQLRLEVEKLHRAEGDWLQVLVRIMDHVYALHQAGVRTGQPGLIAQLGHFQAACCDAARRVGFGVVVSPAGTPFDANTHQLRQLDGQDEPVVPEGACIEEAVAPGYSFQGQLIRRPLVTLRPATPPPPAEEVSPPGRPEPGSGFEDQPEPSTPPPTPAPAHGHESPRQMKLPQGPGQTQLPLV